MTAEVLAPGEPAKKSSGTRRRARYTQMRRDAEGKPCPYCGRPMLHATGRFPTVDRVLPHAAGGTYALVNVLAVCHRCNSQKNDFTLEEWLRRLEKGNDPRAPRIAAILDGRYP